MFDSFCKTVLRNEARDHYRKIKRDVARNERVRNSVTIQHVVWDEYPSSTNILKFLDYEINIENEKLFEALNVLPETNKCVILLHACLRMSDQEISKKLNMSRSTVRNRRIDSMEKLRMTL
jgi:RNA polymerase sigma factor (sigma-70 family)